MKKFNQLIAMLVATIIFVSNTVPVSLTAASDTDGLADNSGEIILNEEAYTNTGNKSYHDYLMEHDGAGHPEQIIEIKGSRYLSQDGADAKVISYNGKDDVLYWDSQEGTVTWEFDVAEEGF